MADRIERTVLIAAPRERVWELITTPEHLGRWFGDAGADVDLRPGGRFALRWRSGSTVEGRVETVAPPRRFAFRWLVTVGAQGDPTPANSTLAEFTLTEEADGTRVTVVESGFAGLAADASERTALLASHTEGWPKELGELVTHAEGR